MPRETQGTTQQLSRPAAIFMGALTFLCGAAVLAAATGVLPTHPGSFEAPRWVVGCAGVIFMAGAFVPVNAAFGLPNWANQLVGLTVALGFATVFNWIAFFPGERHFSGTTFSVPGLQISGGTSQITGRIMFGLGALLCDAILLHGLWRQLRPPAPRDKTR